MNATSLSEVLTEIPGLKVRTNVPIARFTTFKVGGPARVVVTPESVEALSAALRALEDADVPTYIMGNGSNLLVSDAGFDGVILRIGSSLGGIERVGPDALRVGAGTMWGKVLRFSTKEGWTGLEFGTGIPGNLGGAVATNAGTRGGDTGTALIEATIVTRGGDVRTLSHDDLAFRYRRSELPEGAVVVDVLLRAHPGDPELIAQTIRGYQAERRRDQPEREPSAGCIFQNPPGKSAGKLIDEAGLKGTGEGGAIISPVHGNFIINRGGATASDVLRLIDRIRARIRAEYGIELDLEVRKVGF
jgi:UDP-N-acetylmuramate dehydrogenase